jgi:hypothetical protein
MMGIKVSALAAGRFALGALSVGAAATSAHAADVLNAGTGVPYTLTTTDYTQDFNTLKPTSLSPIPDNALPDGWQAFESGSGADGSYRFGSASSNTHGIWSYGSGNDRALGGHANTEIPLMYFGVIFENGLGGVIDGLDITYTGEQWQNGYNRATLFFQYSLDATSIDTGTWTSVSALDFLAPNNAAHVGSQFGIGSTNGNSAAFRTLKNGLIDGLSIGAGETFALRWTLSDIGGVTSDDGLAVDDFKLTASLAQTSAVPEPATWAMMIAGFGMAGAALRRKRTMTVSVA